MKSDDERERDAEPVGEVSETAEAPRWRPRTRVVSEAIVAALSEEGAAEGGAGGQAESEP